jgi:hypothetical protein
MPPAPQGCKTCRQPASLSPGADRSSDEWLHNQPLLPQQTLIFNPAARLAALIRTSSEKSARVAGKVGRRAFCGGKTFLTYVPLRGQKNTSGSQLVCTCLNNLPVDSLMRDIPGKSLAANGCRTSVADVNCSDRRLRPSGQKKASPSERTCSAGGNVAADDILQMGAPVSDDPSR